MPGFLFTGRWIRKNSSRKSGDLCYIGGGMRYRYSRSRSMIIAIAALAIGVLMLARRPQSLAAWAGASGTCKNRPCVENPIVAA